MAVVIAEQQLQFLEKYLDILINDHKAIDHKRIEAVKKKIDSLLEVEVED